MSNEKPKAVVLVSGGLDSATALAMAMRQGYECYTLSFDYGQRTRAELVAAEKISKVMGAAGHQVVSFNLGKFGGSALTDESIDVPESPTEGIPVTYVPARNTIFLSFGLSYAEVLDAQAIFVGVNAVDFSGYPDCRPAYIASYQAMADLATKAGVEQHGPKIEAPLIDMTKAEIIKTGLSLGVDYRMTISCYQADEQGNACGRCDSCRLRAQGFVEAGVEDQTNYMIAK